MRRAYVLAAALGVLTAGCSGDAKKAAPITTAPTTTASMPVASVAYEDLYFGWTADLPVGWVATPFETAYRLYYAGTVVLNRDAPVLSPETLVVGDLPDDAVGFRIMWGEGGPGKLTSGKEATENTFPLRLDSLKNVRRLPGNKRLRVAIDGRGYDIWAFAGPEASSSDLAALDEALASVTFPAAEEGDVVAGVVVLKLAEEYPVGSVTRVVPAKSSYRRPFFLVHGKRFYTLDAFGYDSYRYRCRLRFDHDARELVCPENGARWDLRGRVLVNPDPSRYPDSPLFPSRAGLSWTGRVLG